MAVLVVFLSVLGAVAIAVAAWFGTSAWRRRRPQTSEPIRLPGVKFHL